MFFCGAYARALARMVIQGWIWGSFNSILSGVVNMTLVSISVGYSPEPVTVIFRILLKDIMELQ